MATGKSRGTQSMLVLFFTELEASCFDYVLLRPTLEAKVA
jgi:hypothetical protein